MTAQVAHIEKMVQAVRGDFNHWLLFQQIINLERYLRKIAEPGWEYLPDYGLIEKALAEPKDIAGIEPALIERLHALEELYATLQPGDSQSFTEAA